MYIHKIIQCKITLARGILLYLVINKIGIPTKSLTTKFRRSVLLLETNKTTAYSQTETSGLSLWTRYGASSFTCRPSLFLAVTSDWDTLPSSGENRKRMPGGHLFCIKSRQNWAFLYTNVTTKMCFFLFISFIKLQGKHIYLFFAFSKSRVMWTCSLDTQFKTKNKNIQTNYRHQIYLYVSRLIIKNRIHRFIQIMNNQGWIVVELCCKWQLTVT